MRAPVLLLVCATSLLSRAAAADELDALSDKKGNFGAAMVPATLPPGAVATYGFAGVPELGGGYRQGIGAIELDGRVRFNYFDVALSAQVNFKYAIYHDLKLEIAPWLGLGLVANSGSRYINATNFAFNGLHLEAGAIGVYRLSDTIRGLATVELPFAVSLSPAGGTQTRPTLNAGAEFFVGNDVSVLAMAGAGFDVRKDPTTGATPLAFAYQVRVGLGFRLF